MQFEEPGTPETYEGISWYKRSTDGSDRIVFYEGGIVYYYDDYCSNGTSCETSKKGELNTDTGDFTVHSVELSDDDYYYYKFRADNDNPNTHVKYEYNMEIYGRLFNTIMILILWTQILKGAS